MKVLAIDPGFERVGIAIVKKETGQETLVHSECFKTSSTLPFSERLRAIGEKIRHISDDYAPDALAIETLLFNTNQKTAMKVAEARGVIIYEASRRSIPVFEYTPLQVKIAITSYGRASKDQVTEMIKKLINLEKNKKRLDDEYDAIAVGLTHCAHTKQIYK